MDQSPLEIIISFLLDASDGKPWMTARYLARKAGIEMSGEEVEEMLLSHCWEVEEEDGAPVVRYSSLPSRKTLEVLWGAVEKVGSRPLEGITKNDVADDALGDFEDLDQADVFFSHSHRDYVPVMAVAEYLLRNGVVPWLAETHIAQNEHIHGEIISALGSSQDFVLYLSPNALDSRWTGKEFSYACSRGVPIFVVADVSYPEIVSLLDAMSQGDRCKLDADTAFKGASSDFIDQLIIDRGELVNVFAYSQSEGVEAKHPFARSLVDLPECIRQRRSGEGGTP